MRRRGKGKGRGEEEREREADKQTGAGKAGKEYDGTCLKFSTQKAEAGR